MYRTNKGHLQKPLLSDLDHLSDKARERLGQSWAGVFYQQFFYRLNEQPFAVLYSDAASRPNTPINVLVSLETLKASFGWSDQEMHDNFLFNTQVRYAVGYRNLGEGEFELRTVYNFRDRIRKHMAETGENLIEQAFEQITDQQMVAFEIKSGSLRMDSTQIASNIRQYSRLQLLVEMMQRLYRMLSQADQEHYAEAFAPYLQGSSGQYVYHLKGDQTQAHLQQIGELMQRLVSELRPAYGQHQTYQMLERLFAEQFSLSQTPDRSASDRDDSDDPNWPSGVNPSAVHPDDDPLSAAYSSKPPSELEPTEPLAPVQVRPGQTISPDSLRSPDDPTATYRKKGFKAYQGYVTNLTETCDPNNSFQLILKVQTEPNIVEDADLLLEALPNLTCRTDLGTLYNDAGFCSPDVDIALRLAGIKQIPSALRGRTGNPQYTNLADFHFHFDDQDQLIEMTCPHSYSLTVEQNGSEVYIASLIGDTCPDCRFRKSSSRSVLRFSQAELDVALRRQRCQAYRRSKPRLRAAVEATVGAVKRPFDKDKTPVRGTFRVGLMMIGSAAMVNIRRIARYLVNKRKQQRQVMAGNPSFETDNPHLGRSVSSFWATIWAWCHRWSPFNHCHWAASLFCC